MQVKSTYIKLEWENNNNTQAQATVVDKAALALLVDECSHRCICGGEWGIDFAKSFDSGHVHIMYLCCKKCDKVRIWEGSTKFSDGTYEINRKSIAAWLLVGGEGQHKYAAYMKQWEVGHVARCTYYRHQELFHDMVGKAAEEEFESVINEENARVINDTQVPGSIVKMDTQYACQPKTGKQAETATTTFMIGESNKIVAQVNVSKEQMKEEGNGVKSLDKFATQMGLKDLCEKLEQIAVIVTDGCNSAAKSVADIVKTTKRHKDVEIQKDVWHKSKNLMKKYKVWLKNPENEELVGDVPYTKIKKHFYHSALHSFGNEKTFTKLWLDAPKHWEQTKGLSNDAVARLQAWMLGQWKCIFII